MDDASVTVTFTQAEMEALLRLAEGHRSIIETLNPEKTTGYKTEPWWTASAKLANALRGE